MKESPNATRMSASHASHAQELALFPLFPRNKKHNERTGCPTGFSFAIFCYNLRHE
jgi:hypothetical protein